MKRFSEILLLLGGTYLLSACGGDSSLPEATGKGTIRAINAIETSAALSFLIEERSIGTVSYKNATVATPYDDLTYTFNFDALFAGDTQRTRIASQFLDVVADQDYTLVISGTVASPAVTVWESTERVFDDGETVFQARFAHTADSLGNVDYYFADAAVAPVPGDEVATLSFGQIADPMDFEAGDYVITITSAGNPSDVLYTSTPRNFSALRDQIISPFDGDENDVAPLLVVGIEASGGSAVAMPDPSYPATIEFLNASMALGASDIYDDAALTSQVVTNHTYKELTAPLQIASGSTTFTYTPTGSTSVVSLESEVSAIDGLRYRHFVSGESGALEATLVVPDRAPVESAVKLSVLNTSNNFDFLDIYVVDRGAAVDGAIPYSASLPPGESVAGAVLATGNYDVYVTDAGETATLAGPVAVDATVGDVFDFAVFDTVDPAIVELELLAGP